MIMAMRGNRAARFTIKLLLIIALKVTRVCFAQSPQGQDDVGIIRSHISQGVTYEPLTAYTTTDPHSIDAIAGIRLGGLVPWGNFLTSIDWDGRQLVVSYAWLNGDGKRRYVASPLPSGVGLLFGTKGVTYLLEKQNLLYQDGLVTLLTPSSSIIYATPDNDSHIVSVSSFSNNGIVCALVLKNGQNNTEFVTGVNVSTGRIAWEFPLSGIIEADDDLIWIGSRFILGTLHARSASGFALLNLDTKAVVAKERSKPGTRYIVLGSQILSVDLASTATRVVYNLSGR